MIVTDTATGDATVATIHQVVVHRSSDGTYCIPFTHQLHAALRAAVPLRQRGLATQGSSMCLPPRLPALQQRLTFCRCHLRLLLCHVRGATCYEDVRTYHGGTYDLFKDACEAACWRTMHSGTSVSGRPLIGGWHAAFASCLSPSSSTPTRCTQRICGTITE